MLPLEPEIDETISDQVIIERQSYKPDDVKVFWAYLPFGVALILVGVPFIFFYFNDVRDKNAEKTKEDSKTAESEQKFSTSRQYMAVSIVSCMFGISFSVGSLLCKSIQSFNLMNLLIVFLQRISPKLME